MLNNIKYYTKMASIIQNNENHQQNEETNHDQERSTDLDFNQILISLPRENGWRTPHLYFYQNFWCQSKEIQSIINMQHHFQARDSDIILTSIPKSGTTWLKALVFAIVNRKNLASPSTSSTADTNKHPLLEKNPHDLVPFLEYKLYANNQIPNLSEIQNPRIFATHVPFDSLPNSIKNASKCKLVYICRNPFDTFISSWHFIEKARPKNLGQFSMEEAFDMYCKGVVGFGPFWDHMIGYWKQATQTENKHRVMFLKYEDMKDEKQIVVFLTTLARFLGFPFSSEEVKNRVVEDIEKLCSFGNLKELKVNKNGKSISGFENKSLFRKGEVGDWVNYLSPLMVDQLSRVVDENLGTSGLSFKNV